MDAGDCANSVPSVCGDVWRGRRQWAILCAVLFLASSARLVAHHTTLTWVSADSIRFYRAATAFREDWRGGVEQMADWTAPLPVVVWSQVLRAGPTYRPAIVLHHVLGAISAGLVCWVLLRVSSTAAALAGGLFMALSPQVLFMERWLLAETIHMLLVCLTCAVTILAVGRPGALTLASLGIVLGSAWLTKSSSLALGVMPVALGVILMRRRIGVAPVRAGGAGWAGLALSVVMFAVLVLPWHVHVWRTFRSLNVVCNTQRNFLLYAAESGLFDAWGGHRGNAVLMREAGAVLQDDQPISLQGWAIANHLTGRLGQGSPSEVAAREIVVEEIRRKPLLYAKLVGRTLGFLLGVSARGAREPHDQLVYAYSGHPPLATMPEWDARDCSRGSPMVHALLLRWHEWEHPVLCLAFLLGLAGAVAACCRGADRWRWGLLFGLPLATLLAGHALTLAANSRFLYPFLPLAIASAASPFGRCSVNRVEFP
jgi:hypothetical protein